MKRKSEAKRRLPASAIVVIGLFCAALALAATLAARHIHLIFSPSVKNSERLLEKGKPREALAHLDRAKERSPDKKRGDGKALFLRGKVLFAVLMEEMRRERWGSYGTNPDNWLSHPLAEDAENCFLDAMAISPRDVEIRLALGNLYREQGRFAKAEGTLRSALEIDSENSEAFLALGLLYAEGRRPDAALLALMRAWELDGGNPKIAKNIGYFYRFYADNPGAAVEWLNRYLDLEPKRDPDINFVRAELKDLYERYPEFGEYDRNNRMADRGEGRRFVPKSKSLKSNPSHGDGDAP